MPSLLLALLLLMGAGVARAEAMVTVCFNYGCANESQVVFSDDHLLGLGNALAAATSSEAERKVLGTVIGQMYAWAAEQTPIGADKGGNYADEGVTGRMDCIDHSTTTTNFLKLIEQRGWLRFHRVVLPLGRSFLYFANHYSAALENLGDGLLPVDAKNRLWAIDSWYVDNGKRPWIAPFDIWKSHHAYQ